MNGDVNDGEKNLNKCTEETCPFRLTSSDEVLCYNPCRTEYEKPREDILENWCGVDFSGCPFYLRNLRLIQNLWWDDPIPRMLGKLKGS